MIIAVEYAPDAIVPVDVLRRWYDNLSKEQKLDEGKWGLCVPPNCSLRLYKG